MKENSIVNHILFDTDKTDFIFLYENEIIAVIYIYISLICYRISIYDAITSMYYIIANMLTLLYSKSPYNMMSQHNACSNGKITIMFIRCDKSNFSNA